MRKNYRRLSVRLPILASTMAMLMLSPSAKSQAFGDLLGSAKKVAQAASVTDEQIVATFSQMSELAPVSSGHPQA